MSVVAIGQKHIGAMQHDGIFNRGHLITYDEETHQISYLYGFNYDAYQPSNPLFEIAEGVFIGATAKGGEFGVGTVYKFDITSNNFEILYNLSNSQGFDIIKKPAKYDDKLYFVCNSGGEFGGGSLLEFDLTTFAFDLRFNFQIAQNVNNTFSNPVVKDNHLLIASRLPLTASTNHSNILGINLISFDLDFSMSLGAHCDFDGPGNDIVKGNGDIYIALRKNEDTGFGKLALIKDDGITIFHHCEFSIGTVPNSLIYDQGILYGLCKYGGNYGDGLVFNYTEINQNHSIIHHMNYENYEGGYPANSLTKYGEKLFFTASASLSNQYGNIIGLSSSTQNLDVTQEDESGFYLLGSLLPLNPSLGIYEEIIKFEVYPTAVSDVVNLKISGSDHIFLVTIVDMQGRIVLESECNNYAVISVSNLEPGKYFLKAELNGKSSLLPIVKF